MPYPVFAKLLEVVFYFVTGCPYSFTVKIIFIFIFRSYFILKKMFLNIDNKIFALKSCLSTLLHVPNVKTFPNNGFL